MRSLVPVALFAFVGCSSPNYAVTIRLPSNDLLMRTRSVEVFVVQSCPVDPCPTMTPAQFQSATTVFGSAGNAPLGDVRPGTIGIFARARGSDCVVIASGCVMANVQANGSGLITVPLCVPAMPAPACDPPDVCDNGACPLPDVHVTDAAAD